MLDINLTPGARDPAFKQAVKLVTACCTSNEAVNNELSATVSAFMKDAGLNPDRAAQLSASLTYNLAIFGATAAGEIATLDALARRGRSPSTVRKLQIGPTAALRKYANRCPVPVLSQEFASTGNSGRG